MLGTAGFRPRWHSRPGSSHRLRLDVAKNTQINAPQLFPAADAYPPPWSRPALRATAA